MHQLLSLENRKLVSVCVYVDHFLSCRIN